MEEQGKNIRIDTESEVQSYIGNFKYALEHGAQLTFQDEREVDRKECWNSNTIN